MILLNAVICLTFATFYVRCDEKKWVWNKDSDKPKERVFDRYGDDPARYEIYENIDEPDFSPIYNRPFNPPAYPPGQNFNNRPGFSRPPPLPFIPNERPGGVYVDGNNQYGHGGNPDLLTGPVPSWVKVPPYKQFDTCKCTERFNCPSPGISYGHCDAGKQYCCFNRRGTIDVSHPPSRPIHSPENGVLVGPGGPFDGPHRPNIYRPRPHLPNDVGVLVGPGGPTGIIGRPPHRPTYGNSNGVLIGPSAGGGGFGYGRSKNN